MKKAFRIIVIVLSVLGIIAGMTACTQSCQDVHPADMETYYGCPTSRRVRRLNLKRKRVK